MWVGLPTVLTILGNRVAPSLLDAYLARTNVKGQQSPGHDPPGAQFNTWEPVYGAEVASNGGFDAQAYAHSPQLWPNRHRGWVGAGAAAAAAAAVAVRATR